MKEKAVNFMYNHSMKFCPGRNVKDMAILIGHSIEHFFLLIKCFFHLLFSLPFSQQLDKESMKLCKKSYRSVYIDFWISVIENDQ